jgi:Mrp family chromosome partitioning ATPase
MESTLKGLLNRFTQIVVDTPPLLLVTDAVVLSPLVDGVILVVVSGVTARGALTRAHRILENAGTRVLGMVLNKVDMRFDTYYGSYYGAYARGYSDSYYYEETATTSKKTAGGGRGRFKDSNQKT